MSPGEASLAKASYGWAWQGKDKSLTGNGGAFVFPMTKTIKCIPTKGADGKPNGTVLPIWNSTDSDHEPKQIYVTTVLPGCSKGPHLHKKRMGMFVCIRGNANIVTRTWGTYKEHPTGEIAGFNVVQVPPGMAAMIVNTGDTEAIVLNLPNPAWSLADQDEWPVEQWEYRP